MASSRIWTQVADFISYADNCYATSASPLLTSCTVNNLKSVYKTKQSLINNNNPCNILPEVNMQDSNIRVSKFELQSWYSLLD